LKKKYLLMMLAVVGIIFVGRVLTVRRQSGDSDIDDTEPEVYEDLRSNILGLIDEMESEGLNATAPEDLLSIELFELDPENEELGGIY
jgi:hypothetical protein